MGFAATAGLGAVAGFTIFVGLPVARSRPSANRMAMLNAASIGVLLFLFFQLTGHLLPWESATASSSPPASVSGC